MLYQCVRLLGPETVVVVAGVVVDAGMVVFVVDDVGHGEVVGIIGCVVVVGLRMELRMELLKLLLSSLFQSRLLSHHPEMQMTI